MADDAPERRGLRSAARPDPETGPISRAFSILELVAERGGATAREIAEASGLPLPTVYRLSQELVRNGYLVHLKKRQRFELGYRLHNLDVALHRQVAVPPAVRAVVDSLHEACGMAAYYAVYRGTDVILAHVSDCAKHPRVKPLDFGFNEAAHATAFGKIMLAGMAAEDRQAYLAARGMPPLTPQTITKPARLEAELRDVVTLGIAWESEEMLPGMACGAVAVHGPAGTITGAVSISSSPCDLRRRRQETDRLLREHASQVSRYFRSGCVRIAGRRA
ncbi:IclR family transcriptional regulator [Propionicicella superfundia]|uniref:IclR family transcriptional regulator n=1 Tax=Propionicicella superfundia TaxID=348582 RepID=UPI00041E4A04|nr:IclR family transcriptional regulator [Propionicicella superfundia]